MTEPTLGPLLHQFAHDYTEHHQEFLAVDRADQERHLIRQHMIPRDRLDREIELLARDYPDQFAPDSGGTPSLSDVHEWWHDRRRGRIDFGTRLGQEG